MIRLPKIAVRLSTYNAVEKFGLDECDAVQSTANTASRLSPVLRTDTTMNTTRIFMNEPLFSTTQARL
jgi:hypothetical protein